MWLTQFDGPVGTSFDFDSKVIVNVTFVRNVIIELSKLFDNTVDCLLFRVDNDRVVDVAEEYCRAAVVDAFVDFALNKANLGKSFVKVKIPYSSSLPLAVNILLESQCMFVSFTLVCKAFRKLHVKFRFDVGLWVREDEVDLSRVPTVDDGDD